VRKSKVTLVSARIFLTTENLFRKDTISKDINLSTTREESKY